MASADLKHWTADELLAELRRRERTTAAVAAGKTTRALAQPPGRMGELQKLATGKLTKLAQARQRVIYGVDNRKDIYQVTSARVRAAANSVVALIKNSDLTRNRDGSYALATQSYKEQYDLCDSEPYVRQPLGCFCSGFLVRADVVATAGHCVKSQADLGRMRFVFGFHMLNASQARTQFAADDVYTGVTLIGRQLADDGTDWALVRLDRAVVGRTPVKLRVSGKVGNTQSLFVIGHPSGLPQKYAPGAKVRDNSPGPFFVANLDTYGGNSGSPVFNASTGKVEGILVRGENDYVSNGSCNVSMVCPTTGCRGEDVTRTGIWTGKIPKSKAVVRASGVSAKSRSSAKKAKVGAKRKR
jgi:Trypsin-like peptidase domain